MYYPALVANNTSTKNRKLCEMDRSYSSELELSIIESVIRMNTRIGEKDVESKLVDQSIRLLYMRK